MSLDTFSTTWRQVLLRCPAASVFLAQGWVKYAFRRVAERRRWSWLIKPNQFIINKVVTAGAVALTRNSPTVTGAGTAFTLAMVGRQFRASANFPIYTITDVDVGAQTLTLDQVWGGTTESSVGYELYNAYVTPPTDFHAFISVTDPAFNWQLNLNIGQDELNAVDAQRTDSGTVYIVAWRDYDSRFTPPLPRYELWPHQKADYVYPYLYEARATDLDDANAQLPRFIRGDMLLEFALVECARWPGPSKEQPNPYFNLALAREHERRAELMVMEAEKQDDETFLQDARYMTATGLPFAPLPWGDSQWLQSHSI